MKSALNAPHLCNEEAAIAYVETRLWPDGPVCPHCGTVGEATRLKGKSTRPGLWKCRACRKPFTVRMRSIFESSHVPLHVWLQAIYLICSSKKGISTRQIQRMIGGSMKTAWFLMHRIRLAMDESGSGPLGGEGKIVESDESYTVYKEGGLLGSCILSMAGGDALVEIACRSSLWLSVADGQDPTKPRTLLPKLCAAWFWAASMLKAA